MTREEAIKKLQKQKAEYLDEWVDYSDIAEAFDMAIEALNYLDKNKQTIDLINVFAESFNYNIAKNNNNNWVPCSERLPEYGVETLQKARIRSDLISRQDAIQSMANTIWHYPNALYKNLNNYEEAEALAKDGLLKLPSADRPTGKWVDDCTCNICHWIHEDDNGFALITKYNFCPNCGAKMEGDKDGSRT